MFGRPVQATRDVPKFFGPKMHEVLDFLTSGTFLLMGGAFWRRHRRAGAVAPCNGFFLLGVTLLTDYDGDGKRPIRLRKDGELDVVQAGMAAGFPTLLGFGIS